MDATEKLVNTLVNAGKVVKPNGQDRWVAQCPAHDDGNPSLSIARGRGQVLLFCFAGCTVEQIADAVGWQMEALFDDPKGVEYEYRDRGRTVRKVRRTPEKRFMQDVVEKGSGALYVPGGFDLTAVIGNGATVYIPEGEKDADTLVTIGNVPAVSSAGGAQAWGRADWSSLAGASPLIVVADPDEPGMERARALVKHLRTITDAPVSAVRAAVGKDATDHLVAGLAVEEFIEIDVDYDPEFEARVEDLLWERRAREAAIEREKQEKAKLTSAHLDPKLLRTILDMEFTEDWVIPTLLEKGDRLIVTGGEGSGKSYWLRQIGVMAAAGLSPFTMAPIEPKRVLVVDTENSDRQWSRAAKYVSGLAAQHGAVDPRDTVVVAAGTRIDLSVQADVNQLHKMIDEHQPDILQIGPLYKLVSREITTDTDAAPLIKTLDGLRERGLVLLMEAHTGNSRNSPGNNYRPRGSSALLGWPEFGFALIPDADNPEMVDLGRWRGDREQRDWPNGFRRGWKGELPWMPTVGGL